MLTGNLDEIRHVFSEAYPLVQNFARRHMSRFPMTFRITSGGWVAFYDSRFDEPVGYLRKNNGKLVVQSDRIHNHQYKKNNLYHNTRSTKNHKLIEQWLTTYMYPVNDSDIHAQTYGLAKDLHGSWKNQFHSEVDSLMSSYGSNAGKVRAAFVSDMLSNLMEGTAPYSHPDLQPFKTPEFVEKVNEHKRRTLFKAPTHNIFINPDNTVVQWTGEHKNYNSVNELDEAVRGALAVLKLAEDKTVVGYVGIKIHNNNFWLY